MDSDNTDSVSINNTEMELSKTSQSTWEHEDLARVKIRVLRSHTDSVNSCCLFDNDTKVLSASSDKSIKVWDFEMGNLLQDFPNAHSDVINKARTSRDGTKMASVGWDRRVILKDITTGTILMQGEHGGVVLCCDFSHDDRMLMTGSDLANNVKLWDVRSAEMVLQVDDLHAKTITSCIFTSDDTRLVTSSMDCSTKLWDIRSQKITLTLKDHINIVSSSDISRDGHHVATASWDKTVKIWDVQTGVFRSQGPLTLDKGHDGSVSSCKFSDNGRELVTGSYDKTVIVWDVNDQVQKIKLQGHSDWVEDVDISKDGQWILSASKDNTLRLWNLAGSLGILSVLENRRSIGLKIVQCTTCGKPFPLGQLTGDMDSSVCVFCRVNRGHGSHTGRHM